MRTTGAARGPEFSAPRAEDSGTAHASPYQKCSGKSAQAKVLRSLYSRHPKRGAQQATTPTHKNTNHQQAVYCQLRLLKQNTVAPFGFFSQQMRPRPRTAERQRSPPRPVRARPQTATARTSTGHLRTMQSLARDVPDERQVSRARFLRRQAVHGR
jgi:hypothetical protein